MFIKVSIEGNTNLIQVDPKTNPNRVVGANIQEVWIESYSRLQEKVENEMKQLTLAELIHKIAVLENEHHPEKQGIIKKFLYKNVDQSSSLLNNNSIMKKSCFTFYYPLNLLSKKI